MKPSQSFSARSGKAQSGKKRKVQWRRWLPWSVGLALVLLVIIGFIPEPLAVEVAEAKYAPLTVSILEEGKTRIRNRYQVSPPVAGRLQRVSLRAGDPVVQGETVLAVLKPELTGLLDSRSRGQFEARLRAAIALQELRRAELERSQEMLALTEKEYARIESLFRNQAVPVQEWDNTQSRVQVRKREVRAAEFALKVAGFEVEQARAALLQGEKETSDGESVLIPVISPVSGYVLQVFEESERSVTPMNPIMEVGDPQDLEAEIELLSMDAVAVQPGAKVSIEHWGGEQVLEGRVSLVEKGGYTKISALGVEEQRVRVRVDFMEPFPEGKPLGDRYRVEARIVIWHEDQVLQVPVGALFRRGNDWMVYTIANQRATARKVEVGRQNGFFAQILGGLSEGDVVILYPSDQVAEGERVKHRVR